MISKLVALSVSKLGIEMEESQAINLNKGAEIVLIDDECFDQELFDSYKTENSETKFGLFYAKSTERLEGFDEYIQKPFLPTDLVKTLSKISGITPVDSQQIHKDDDEELDLGGVESLDNLEDELDLSGFDDLQLDDEESSMESGSGEEQLDFGAEEGIEEAVENPDAPLDFGAEEGIEEAATESGEEQLDFGAEDLEEESQDLNVLDKGDVEEIKDLLSSEEESPKQDDALLDLDKELDMGSDSSASEDLDFGDLQDGLGGIEALGEETESQDEDVQLEGLDSEGITGNSADFTESGGEDDFAFDDLDTKEPAEDLEATDLTQATPEEAESDMGLDNLTSEMDSENTQDLGDLNVDSLDSTSSDDNALGGIGEVANELGDSDFGALDLPSEDLEATEEAETTSEDLESLGDLGEMADSSDLGLETSEEVALDTGETESQEIAEETLSEAESEESLEIPESLGEDLDLTPQDDMNAEEVESLPEASALDSSLDEFDSLSEEGMSEALGEPITKAPNPAPIVPSTEAVADSTLPSNIQANSLESLIGALQALQSQNLKDLLSGATISINIQFPKKD